MLMLVILLRKLDLKISLKVMICSPFYEIKIGLAIKPAGCIFRKGAGASCAELYHIPDDIGQISIPFDFQDDRGSSCRNGGAFRIQEAGTLQSGADIIVNRYSDIAGGKQVGFSRIVYDCFGTELLCRQFKVEFRYKRIRAVTHPGIVAACDRLRLVLS